jgi:hypothetical protein
VPAVFVHEPDAVEDLHCLVRVQRGHHLRERVQIPVDELAQAPVVIDCACPRAPRDEQLEAGNAEGVLDVDGHEADP